MKDLHGITEPSFISFMIKVRNCKESEGEERVIPANFKGELFHQKVVVKKEDSETDSENIDEISILFKIIKYVQYSFTMCWKIIMNPVDNEYYSSGHELLKFLNDYYASFKKEEINNIEQIKKEKLFELKEFLFISKILLINRKRKDLVENLKKNQHNFNMIMGNETQ